MQLLEQAYLSVFGWIIGCLLILGALQMVYFLVSGGIPGTSYYFGRRLRDPSGIVRMGAIKQLAQRADALALGMLLEAVKDRESAIRVAAAKALARYSDPAVIEALVRLSRDENAGVRSVCIELLSKHQDDRAVAAIADCLKDGQSAVRIAALRALGQLKAVETLDELAQAITDRDPEVTRVAKSTVGSFGAQAIPSLAAVLPDSGNAAKHVIDVMIEADSLGAFEPLYQALMGSRSLTVVVEILAALARMDHPQTIDVMVPLLEDPAFPARDAVIEALVFMRDPAAIGPLCQALGDPDPMIRKLVAQGLDRLVTAVKSAEMIDPLCVALRDPDRQVRRYAAQILGKFGGTLVLNRVIDAMWGELSEMVKDFLEVSLGTQISKLVSYEDIALALDKLLTGTKGEQTERAIAVLESLLIVLYSPFVRGHRFDAENVELLVKSRRTTYPVVLAQLHPLAAELVEFVPTRAEGDRWRTTVA